MIPMGMLHVVARSEKSEKQYTIGNYSFSDIPALVSLFVEGGIFEEGGMVETKKVQIVLHTDHGVYLEIVVGAPA